MYGIEVDGMKCTFSYNTLLYTSGACHSLLANRTFSLSTQSRCFSGGWRTQYVSPTVDGLSSESVVVCLPSVCLRLRWGEYSQ